MKKLEQIQNEITIIERYLEKEPHNDLLKERKHCLNKEIEYIRKNEEYWLDRNRRDAEARKIEEELYASGTLGYKITHNGWDLFAIFLCGCVIMAGGLLVAEHPSPGSKSIFLICIGMLITAISAGLYIRYDREKMDRRQSCKLILDNFPSDPK